MEINQAPGSVFSDMESFVLATDKPLPWLSQGLRKKLSLTISNTIGVGVGVSCNFADARGK